MAKTVKTKTGKTFRLLMPHEKGEKYARELRKAKPLRMTASIRRINTGKIAVLVTNSAHTEAVISMRVKTKRSSITGKRASSPTELIRKLRKRRIIPDVDTSSDIAIGVSSSKTKKTKKLSVPDIAV